MPLSTTATSSNPQPPLTLSTPHARLAQSRTLPDVFLTTVAAHPDALALDTPHGTYTYREFLALANAQARTLSRHGIGAGDRVGIRIPSGTPELYIGIMGALLCGAAYVPVDADDTDQRATTVWREAAVCGVLTGSGQSNAMPTLTLSSQVTPLGKADGTPQMADDAWVIFTSGSTGVPKGVAVTHDNAVAFLRAESQLFLQNEPIGPSDRVMAALSCAFDASIEEMWLAWAYGACLVAAPRSMVRDVVDVEQWIHDQRITIISTVPSLAAMWNSDMISQVRLLIVGGEACPASLVERLAGPKREMWNTYGPTETTVVATATQLFPGEPVLIGHALPGWQVAVISPEGEPVPEGERGELVVGGAGLARYLDPELDAAKFAPLTSLGWSRAYRTGDGARLTPRGVEYLGRLDDQVKIAGRRLELGEVDALLAALPGVAMAAAAVRRTEAGNSVLVGYVLPEHDAPLDLVVLRAEAHAVLPPGISIRLAEVSEIPVKLSGKVDRAALPWPLERQDTAATSVLRDPEELAVATVWAQVLGLELGEVCADDDFFAAGGGSLAAAQLVTALRRQCPALAVADVYASRTVAALGGRVRELTAQAEIRAAADDPVAGPAVHVGSSVLTQCAQILGFVALRSGVAMGVAISIVLIFWLVELPAEQMVAAVAALLVLASPPVRMLLAVVLIRAMRPSQPFGVHARGGWVHLRLRAASIVLSMCGMASYAGTIVNVWLARLLGCDVGTGVFLNVVPPVHGGLTVGNNAVVEHQADLSGVAVSGTRVLVGRVTVGESAVVSTRATVMPNVRVAPHAVLAAGVAAHDDVAASSHDASSTPHAGPTLVPRTRQQGRRGWWNSSTRVTQAVWHVAYLWGSAVPGAVTIMSLLPLGAAIVWSILSPDATPTSHVLLALTLAALLSIVTYGLATVVVVRVLNRWVVPGEHPLNSLAALASWLVVGVTSAARVALFPLYASQASSLWLRLLGAKVGKNVEISTVTGLPMMLSLGHGSFLADDVLVTAPSHRPGTVLLGPVVIGERSFVGNSGIVLPGTVIGDDALIGVLTTAPLQTPSGTSWLGRPAISLPRHVDRADDALTYAPGVWVRLGRGCVEAARIVPMVLTLVFFEDVMVRVVHAYSESGWAAALTTALLLGWMFTLLAGVAAVAAKWLLVGRIRTDHHPLWSSFVWRNELADCFLESLAMPWLLTGAHGTPIVVAWLRACGAKIGRNAWCETHWFPEHDIIRVGDGVTLNRGVVVQTHLFHDRIMRVEPIEIGAGSTLSVHAITLPDTMIGEGTAIGAGSLVMRGEAVPAATSWEGNPIRMVA